MSKDMSPKPPLHGVRVLNLGGIWAGRLASMLLADQGAEVIEIERPQGRARPEDALLTRGKRIVRLDLSEASDRQAAFRLASGADIVIDNLGTGRAERFGLDHASLSRENAGLVMISMPGFASTSPESQLPATEGVIGASLGVYTDLHATGALLGGDPIYTAVPMASAYGGVHAAINATVAYLHRLRTGTGQHIEVPLADALMAGMALLAMKIDGQPARFDLPAIDKAMTDVAFPIIRALSDHLTPQHRAAISSYLKSFAKPLFTHYRCADGKLVFLNALDHVHHSRASLQALGLLDQLIAEGMVLGTPYEEGGHGNNLANAATLDPKWVARLQTLMTARFASRTADEWCAVLQSAGVPCARVRTAQEWLADPVARDSGCVARPDAADASAGWQAGRFVSMAGEGAVSPALTARRVVARDVQWAARPVSQAPEATAGGGRGMLDGVRVLDFSNVIAGPVSARTLAEFGAQVIRIDAPAPLAGPRMTMWFGADVNQGKRALILDLKSEQGRQVMADLVRTSDVVIHNFLDPSLPGIGLTEEQLRSINPDIVRCQVSAWAGPEGGAYKDFPAFDPVLQAATGITARYGSPAAPVMHGVASCVDYITGFTAALGVAQALVARQLGRGGTAVSTSLAMGAQLVQFPFMVDAVDPASVASGQHQKGSAANHAMYKSQSGWVFVSCRSGDLERVAAALGATGASQPDIAAAVARLDADELSRILGRFAQACAVRVTSLEKLREERTMCGRPRSNAASPEQDATEVVRGSTPLVEADHPSGYRTTLPIPSWARQGERLVLKRLAPAPMPGTHTRDVVEELGYADERIAQLYEAQVIRDGWAVHKTYFPR